MNSSNNRFEFRPSSIFTANNVVVAQSAEEQLKSVPLPIQRHYSKIQPPPPVREPQSQPDSEIKRVDSEKSFDFESRTDFYQERPKQTQETTTFITLNLNRPTYNHKISEVLRKVTNIDVIELQMQNRLNNITRANNILSFEYLSGGLTVLETFELEPS